jgi:hypothetical protein
MDDDFQSPPNRSPPKRAIGGLEPQKKKSKGHADAAAVKLFIKHALEALAVVESKKAFSYRKRSFKKVWVQVSNDSTSLELKFGRAGCCSRGRDR